MAAPVPPLFYFSSPYSFRPSNTRPKQKKRAKLLKGPMPIATAAPVAVFTIGEVTGSAPSLATDKAVHEEASSETAVPVSSDSSTVSLRQFFQPSSDTSASASSAVTQEVPKTVETADPEPAASAAL
jgi:hypothetical protein